MFNSQNYQKNNKEFVNSQQSIRTDSGIKVTLVKSPVQSQLYASFSP